jgi:hypothetical protein
MQRAPERRRGAGPLLLLALLVALAAAPRLVRAVTDATDGTLVLPLPVSSALLCSQRAGSVDRFATARSRAGLVWSFVLPAQVGCSGLVGGTVLYCEAKHPSRARRSD